MVSLKTIHWTTVALVHQYGYIGTPIWPPFKKKSTTKKKHPENSCLTYAHNFILRYILWSSDIFNISFCSLRQLIQLQVDSKNCMIMIQRMIAGVNEQILNDCFCARKTMMRTFRDLCLFIRVKMPLFISDRTHKFKRLKCVLNLGKWLCSYTNAKSTLSPLGWTEY